MKNKLMNKKGNEIIQALVIVAILGAAAVSICIALSNQLRASTVKTTNVLSEGTEQIYGG